MVLFWFSVVCIIMVKPSGSAFTMYGTCICRGGWGQYLDSEKSFVDKLGVQEAGDCHVVGFKYDLISHTVLFCTLFGLVAPDVYHHHIGSDPYEPDIGIQCFDVLLVHVEHAKVEDRLGAGGMYISIAKIGRVPDVGVAQDTVGYDLPFLQLDDVGSELERVGRQLLETLVFEGAYAKKGRFTNSEVVYIGRNLSLLDQRQGNGGAA